MVRNVAAMSTRVFGFFCQAPDVAVGEKDRPGKIYREDVSGEQNHQRAGFRQEDVPGADRKAGKREAVAADWEISDCH